MSSKDCIELTREDREILQRIHDTLAGEIYNIENIIMKTAELVQFTDYRYIVPTQNNVLFAFWGVIYAFLIIIALLQAKSYVGYAVYVVLTIIIAVFFYCIYRKLNQFQDYVNSFKVRSVNFIDISLKTNIDHLEIRLNHMEDVKRKIISKYELDRFCTPDKVLVELINNHIEIMRRYVTSFREMSSDLKKKK